MKDCWFCHEKIAEDAAVCPNCGRRDPHVQTKKAPPQQKRPVNDSRTRSNPFTNRLKQQLRSILQRFRYRLWQLDNTFRFAMRNSASRTVWLSGAAVIVL